MIEYSQSKDSVNQYKRAKALISMAYPKAEITARPVPGNGDYFEMVVNGRLVHSMLNGDGPLDNSKINKMMIALKGVLEDDVVDAKA